LRIVLGKERRATRLAGGPSHSCAPAGVDQLRARPRRTRQRRATASSTFFRPDLRHDPGMLGLAPDPRRLALAGEDRGQAARKRNLMERREEVQEHRPAPFSGTTRGGVRVGLGEPAMKAEDAGEGPRNSILDAVRPLHLSALGTMNIVRQHADVKQLDDRPRTHRRAGQDERVLRPMSSTDGTWRVHTIVGSNMAGAAPQ
jgi:hypothetical protein